MKPSESALNAVKLVPLHNFTSERHLVSLRSVSYALLSVLLESQWHDSQYFSMH